MRGYLASRRREKTSPTGPLNSWLSIEIMRRQDATRRDTTHTHYASWRRVRSKYAAAPGDPQRSLGGPQLRTTSEDRRKLLFKHNNTVTVYRVTGVPTSGRVGIRALHQASGHNIYNDGTPSIPRQSNCTSDTEYLEQQTRGEELRRVQTSETMVS
ncbi:hypothetical protein J6590_027703 [Homalodisca vitripennis]|nr:hypothetical protein J6590_027703 [Homalodisca vitripennis]